MRVEARNWIESAASCYYIFVHCLERSPSSSVRRSMNDLIVR